MKKADRAKLILAAYLIREIGKQYRPCELREALADISLRLMGYSSMETTLRAFDAALQHRQQDKTEESDT